MSTDNAPRPQAVTDGMVRTEAHMFNLVDIEATVAGQRPPAPGPALVTVGAGALLATFSSELEDNQPQVVLEHWTTGPPEPEGPWERQALEQLTVQAGQLALGSGISGLPAPHRLTVPPGHYRLGVWCRGRAAARAGELAAIDAGTALKGVEEWLIRLWPTSA
ncbi:hypothetical protein ACFV98_42975 [Streptomyces violascens]|uniref:hypothetical protein n=1 Tax=Streptomyces violascens TaxID=67381 RepID=UPI00365FCEFC